ncbi:MAG: phage major capsid protein [Bacteroidales bacterium]|nr:phage major capsid protein [Bacteroidales bacterium]
MTIKKKNDEAAVEAVEAEVVTADTEDVDLDAVKSLINESVKSASDKSEDEKREAVEKAVAEKVDAIAEQVAAKYHDKVKDNRRKALSADEAAANRKKGVTTRKFFRALLDGDKAGAKALTTSDSGTSPDDAQAGLTIPEELLTEVLRISESGVYGVARREFRYLPFTGPGNSRVIPALGTTVSLSWTGEGDAKTSTQPKFTVVTQVLKKLAAIVPMTEEILEDSGIDLVALIGELIVEAVSKEEDTEFFVGDGTVWTGILYNGSVNSVTTATGSLSADDLLDMQDKTPAGALANAKYFMHRSTFNACRKLKGDDGQYIVQSPVGDQPAMIWNRPVVLVEAMPEYGTLTADDEFVIFGDLKTAAILGDKQQIRTKLLTEATIHDTDGQTGINLAEQDMVALRFVERVGYVLAVPTAVTVLKLGEDVSA